MYCTFCSKSHTDCASYSDGKCTALVDTDFPTKDCPFYKTRQQAEAEREGVRERLKELGMLELAGLKYGYPSSFYENKRE